MVQAAGRVVQAALAVARYYLMSFSQLNTPHGRLVFMGEKAMERAFGLTPPGTVLSDVSVMDAVTHTHSHNC